MNQNSSIVGSVLLAGMTTFSLAGCAVHREQAFEATAPYSGPFIYAAYFSHAESGLGPSLISGDALAFQIVLAGGYDLPPADDRAPRVATVPDADH